MALATWVSDRSSSSAVSPEPPRKRGCRGCRRAAGLAMGSGPHLSPGVRGSGPTVPRAPTNVLVTNKYLARACRLASPLVRGPTRTRARGAVGTASTDMLGLMRPMAIRYYTARLACPVMEQERPRGPADEMPVGVWETDASA